MKNKVLYPLLGIAFVAMTLFSACGEQAGDDVAIHLFHYKQEAGEAIQDLVAAFNEAHPGIVLTTEYIANESDRVLMSRMQAGNPPDLMMLQGYAKVFEFADAGWILDLDETGLLDLVVDGAKGAVTRSGAAWAVPTDLAAIGVLYNKDIFAQYNLTVPTTFAEMQAVAQTLTSNGVTPMAVSISDDWPLGHYFSMAHTAIQGDDILNWIEGMNAGTRSFNEDGMTQVWRAMDFYRANGGARPNEMTYNDQVNAFASGEAAMMIQGLWAYNAAREITPELNAGFFPMPFTNNASETKIYADTDSTIAISSAVSAEKLEAAVTFLSWLMSPAGVDLWINRVGLIPTAVGADTSDLSAPAQDLLGYMDRNESMPWAFSMWPSATFEESKTNMGEYYSGSKTAAQVMSFLDNHWRSQVR